MGRSDNTLKEQWPLDIYVYLDSRNDDLQTLLTTYFIPQTNEQKQTDSNGVDMSTLLSDSPEVDLSFEGIRMTLAGKNRKNGDRVLLDGSLRGRAQPGRMLAIMGPSGAGE